MLDLSVSANSIKRIKIGEMYMCSITFFFSPVALYNSYIAINCSTLTRQLMEYTYWPTVQLLLEGKIWMLQTSFLSFAAIEYLVSGFVGIKSIKERRKPSCKFRSNSRIMIQIPLQNTFDYSFPQSYKCITGTYL